MNKRLLKLSKSLYSSCEIAHFYSDSIFVGSRHRNVIVDRFGIRDEIVLPKRPLDIFGFSRLLRRVLRLDKCNVFPLDLHGRELLLIRGGVLYKYDRQGLHPKLRLKMARNILHTDLCVTRSGRIIFGEYGANAERKSIPIYSSDDNGLSWRVIYEIPAGKAKHVHGVYADKYSDSVWVYTGDSDGECWVIQADEDFMDVHYIGDGSQLYRACQAFFTPDYVVWVMDSPLRPSMIVRLARGSHAIETPFTFAGPVWYGREISGAGYVVASSVEPGASVVERKAAIYFSEDLAAWSRVAEFRKDVWPINIFKFGVVGFSRGDRADGEFYIFGEALEGLDGKAMKCRIA